MSKNIKEMLRNEIVSGFESLNDLDIGSKERSSAVEDLAKLYRLTIEESKVDQEVKLKKAANKDLVVQQSEELELKKKQFELDKEIKNQNCENFKLELYEKKRDQFTKIGISIAELILPLMFYAVWMKRGLEFEKTGTYTSTTFRGLFSHFRPTRKS